MFLVLHADDAVQQILTVIGHIAGLFPNILQDDLRQSVFVHDMRGAGGQPASAVIAAHKGTVTSLFSVLVLKLLYMVPHSKATVRTVNKSGKNAFDAILGFALADAVLVDAHHGIPHIAGNDWLMGSLYANPLVLGLVYQLAGFIGQRSVLALDHVADVDFVPNNGFYRSVGPQVIGAAGIGFSLALIIPDAGRLDAFLIERRGDLAVWDTGGAHGKDAAHDGRSFLVDNQVVFIFGVTLVPK